MSEPGHNSAVGAEIRQFVDRAIRLEEEKAGISSDISELYKEAKGRGLNPKTLKTIVKRERMDASKREQEEADLALYLKELGQLRDSPLGDYALASRAA